MSTENIKAIHSADIEEYLASLGALDDVKGGTRQCEICKKTITIENIACLYPENQQVRFVCNDATCVDAIIKKRGAPHG